MKIVWKSLITFNFACRLKLTKEVCNLNMPETCCVLLCNKTGYRIHSDGRKVTFHILPKDPSVLKVCVAILNICDLFLTSNVVSSINYYFRPLFRSGLPKLEGMCRLTSKSISGPEFVHCTLSHQILLPL